MSATSAGYSGTPLAKKLGIKAGQRVLVIDAPNEYSSWLQIAADEVAFVRRASTSVDLAHVFVTDRAELAARLKSLRAMLSPESVIWVSWPKKSSKVPTTITEDTVRELALPLGFVDVKVCAVNEVWSALKLVVRKSLR